MGDVIKINPRILDISNKYEDTALHGGGNGGGDGMLEPRVAKLEADVENIKANLAEARADIRDLKTLSAEIKSNISVLLQLSVDIKESLSKKPSKDEVDTKILSSSNKQICWTIASFLAIASISVTIAVKVISH